MARMVVKDQKDNTKEQPERRIEILHSPKWVRVYFGGEYIADSKNAVLVRERGHFLTYYFPPQDVRMDVLGTS